MKKIIIFILFLTALHTLKGESFKCGELHYSINKFDKSTVEVMCSDYSVFSGYPSTRNYSKLTSVVIPSSVVHNNKTYRLLNMLLRHLLCLPLLFLIVWGELPVMHSIIAIL